MVVGKSVKHEMMEKHLIPILFSLFVCQGSSLRAQSIPDSTLLSIERAMEQVEKTKLAEQEVEKYEHNLLRQEMTFRWTDAAPLLGGLIQTATNRSFNDRPVRFIKNRHDAVDYLPASLPLATAWALKAFGVESRSKIKRMATANAIALGLNVALTQTFKHVTRELRPDGTDKHSLPSGHAAFAYLSATILHREFGHQSPWLSVGGYAAATATELLRLHHNAHYLNDIFLGAGIGITSTNVAYWLTDKIYGAKEINRPNLYVGDVLRLGRYLEQPISLSLVSGTEIRTGSIQQEAFDLMDENFDGNISLHPSSTLTSGLEYSYFFNSNIAAEGIVRVSATKIKPVVSESAQLHTGDIYGENLSQYHANLAIKYSIPIGLTQRFALRALAGDRYTQKTEFERVDNGATFLQIPSSHRFEWGAGLSFESIGNEKYVAGFNFDYLHTTNTHLQPNKFIISTFWKIIL